MVSCCAEVAFDAGAMYIVCLLRFVPAEVLAGQIGFISCIPMGTSVNEATEVLSVRASFAFDFFFQAEDGIRDGHVTGVQTCALPIFCRLSGSRPAISPRA